MKLCTLDVQCHVWILVGFTRLPQGFDLVNWNVVMGSSIRICMIDRLAAIQVLLTLTRSSMPGLQPSARDDEEHATGVQVIIVPNARCPVSSSGQTKSPTGRLKRAYLHTTCAARCNGLCLASITLAGSSRCKASAPADHLTARYCCETACSRARWHHTGRTRHTGDDEEARSPTKHSTFARVRAMHLREPVYDWPQHRGPTM